MDDTYNVTDPRVWGPWHNSRVYRFIPADAEYQPWEPAAGGGRFDNGSRPTLYLSRSAEGAAAEFFRRNPELVGMQDKVKRKMYSMELLSMGEGLDVSTEHRAGVVGIPYERLRSSESDEGRRYRECRVLADDVDANEGIGIRHPCAALDGVTNVVTFKQAGPDTWEISSPVEEEIPWVDPAGVRFVES